MKILFLAHNGKLYGANRSLLSLVINLSKTHDILVFAASKNYYKNILDENNIKSFSIPYYASFLYVRLNIKYIIYPLLFLLDVAMFPFLLYKAWKFKPDVIYSNSSIENIGFLISKILGKKYIIHVREFGEQDFDFHFIFGKGAKKNYLNKADGVIFNSKIVEATVLPKEEQKVLTRVIYNGIKIQDLAYENLKLPSNGVINFGIVGYLQSNKRQFDALVYLKKHLKDSQIKLKIFGDGSPGYIAQITNYIKENTLQDDVFLMGFSKNIDEAYKDMHILLVFAKYEAFGRVTIEAMERGIPVIAFNGGGSKELINNNLDGFLFNDEAEFDNYVMELLQNPQQYELISKNSMNKVKSMFSESIYCKNVDSFIKEVYSIAK